MPTDPRRNLRALAAAAAALLLMGASAASPAAVRATLERDTVPVGATLTLSIESDAAQANERPDLAPLERDFELLGTSTSSETRIVNGARTDRTRWLVQLQPRRAGTLVIPPIAVGNETTAALELKVAEPAPPAASEAAKHVFVEVEAAAPGPSIYVQQQIPYTARLYYDDKVYGGNMAAPEPADATVAQLGEDRLYDTVRDGRKYHVIERRYAIAPEKSGALRISAAGFHGTMAAPRDSGATARQEDSLMARLLRGTPFANDPFSYLRDSFGGLSYGRPGEPVTARGREITLKVEPRPAAAQRNWLPAEQITLHDSWADNPPRFKVGEPVTRTLTIDAKGLAASQIPPLALAAPANARLYPEAPDNQSRTDGRTIYGVSKQSVTYIPGAQGTLEVAPVELAWWNTLSDRQSSATLPARQYTVAPGVAPGQPEAAPPAAAAAPAPAIPAPHVASWSTRLRNQAAWLAAGAALLVALALAVIVIRRRARAAPARPERRAAALRALRRACATNDRLAAQAALLDLGRAEWPDEPPRGLTALAARLSAGVDELVALDRSLYGVGGSLWEGRSVWETFRRGLRPKREAAPPEDDGLGALYP
ncbi:MAG: BatD family protein [Burkholderiales bacterium]